MSAIMAPSYFAARFSAQKINLNKLSSSLNQENVAYQQGQHEFCADMGMEDRAGVSFIF
jgi:hypothetical protein